MKSLLLIFLSLIVFCSFTYASDFNYQINLTTLPFNTTESITIGGYSNMSVNFSYDQYLSGIDNINFTGEDYILLIHVDVPIDAINTTSYLKIISDNSTQNISFGISIINNTYVYQPDVDFIQLDVNDYEYIFCDYMLPKNFTHEISISGRDGQLIQTEYDSNFFYVIDEFYIPPANYSIIDIGIKLDENLSIGNYDKSVWFNVVSLYNNITFHFKIIDCLTPPPKYKETIDAYQDMITACSINNKTTEELIECQRLQAKYASLQAEYNNEMYNAMLEMQEEKVINNTVIEYVNYTERVPVLDLKDPELIKTLKEIPVTWKQMIVEDQRKDNEIKESEAIIQALKEENKNVTIKMIKDQMEKFSGLMLENQNLKEQSNSYIKKSSVFWFIFIVVSGICSVFGFISIKENYFWY